MGNGVEGIHVKNTDRFPLDTVMFSRKTLITYSWLIASIIISM